MLIVEVAEEERAGQRELLGAYPREARGIEQIRLGEGGDCREQLVEDSARVAKHIGEGAVTVVGVIPRVDLIRGDVVPGVKVGLCPQFRWPGLWR